MRRRLRADARTFLVDWVIQAPEAERVIPDAALRDLKRAGCASLAGQRVKQTEYADGSKLTTRVELYRLTPRGHARGWAIFRGRCYRAGIRTLRATGSLDEAERVLLARELPVLPLPFRLR